jgi:prepilin-type N-terminal cleavage/methylation domain-containing protein
MKSMTSLERRESSKGFTLIELLVVISIIAILASLLVPAATAMMGKAKRTRVTGDLNQLVSAISAYKLELGEYPPDNGKMAQAATEDDRRAFGGKNPLFYELSGAVFETPAPGSERFRAKSEVITPAQLIAEFNVEGIRNSARRERDIEYKGMTFRSSQYQPLASGDVQLLVVPVREGPYLLDGKNGKINPWFYDASSTNRHNRQSFDLWAEVKIGKKTYTIGNW